MRLLSVSTAFILSITTALAGGEHLPVGARFAGMGHASTTLSDLWSVRANQAGLAALEHPVAGAYYQQHWFAPDLAMQGLAFALPVGNGCFAVNANTFGSTLYAERQFGIAYALKLSDGLRVGVQLDYLDLRLGEGYGSRGMMTAELGVQAKLSEHLWIGAHLYNPNKATIGGPYGEKAPTELRAGLGYTFNDQVLLTGEVAKDIDRAERYHAGLEYRVIKVLALRTGVSTGPEQAHFGVGLRLQRLDLDMAVAVRSRLGATPMVNLNYRFE
ncbi:MAG: hypothetical protein QM724_12210 [Flavobacteriales bacterium]